MGVTIAVENIVVLINPGVGVPALVVVAVAIGDVEVPEHHLEAWVNTVAALVNLRAQAIAVNVVRQLLRNLEVDKRHHVHILAIAHLGIGIVGRVEGIFHHVDLAGDIVILCLGQVLIFGLLELVVDISVVEPLAVLCHGVILRGVGHLVGAVHLEQIATGELIALLAWVVEIQSLLALGGQLTHDVDAIVGAVEEKLAVLALRAVEHPRAL